MGGHAGAAAGSVKEGCRHDKGHDRAMKFLVLRVLTHSELGMFHEYRRQGKEGSKQRAINFDGDVVDRVFPTAADSDRIALELLYDTDAGISSIPHWLTRQAKNWRLEGNCPRDTRYGFVEPGCLFAMEVDSGRSPALGSWVVFAPADPVAQAVFADGSTARLARAGMIALHGEEGARVRLMLHNARPDMFGRVDEKGYNMAELGGKVAGGRRLPPRPQRLAEIIAQTGHTLASAVADIVDNSISADATEIDICFSEPNAGHGRWMTISDNGHGMDAEQLAEAMTLGSDVDYETNSLGKFGYGLKGASWSQAKVFTVVTRRRDGQVSHLSWDRDNLGDWVAGDEPLEDWEAEVATPGVQGTVVLWKDMKPPASAPTVPGVTPWTAEISQLSRELGLVFHRFIEGEAKNRKKVTIRINGVPVKPNNPVGHPLALPYDEKTVLIPVQGGTEPVTIRAHLLPSEDEVRNHHKAEGPAVVNEELNRLGLYGRRNESQGLFVYRNDRLIKWGGWHDIWTTSDEKTKLARVIVAFGTKLDEPFAINITKRSVSLPGSLQEHIKKQSTPARAASKAKYSKIGVKPAPPPRPTTIQGGEAVLQPLPPTSGPLRPLAPGGGRSPAPIPAPAHTHEEVQVSVRMVTSARFGWKIGPNLTGGRDLQISSRFAPLVALAARLDKDPDGIRELAAFLGLLDEKNLQSELLGEKDEA